MKMSFTENHEVKSKEEWLKELDAYDPKDLNRTCMNQLVMNYLVTEGFKEAAEKFQQESGVSPSIDLNTLDNRIQIRNAIVTG